MMNEEKQRKLEETAAILHILGHPDRLRILVCLLREECYVKDLADRMGLPQSTVSQHLRVMTDRGILESERRGVKVCYKSACTIAEQIAKLLMANCE
jgi:ArsR family transcriptional regulator